MLRLLLISCFFIFYCTFFTNAQLSNERSFKKLVGEEIITIDTLAIYPNSFIVLIGNDTLDSKKYSLSFGSNKFQLYENQKDTLTFHYKVLPFNFQKTYQIRDSKIVFNSKSDEREKFKIPASYSVQDIFGGNELSKSGSISRGVSFGNNQDLGINSNLNLELSGDLSPNLKLLAAVSDANLPIQPDGNTNKLQEFDQVFIQVYNDKFKLIAGDFWISKPQGYFLNYKKRGQGLTGDYSWLTKNQNQWKSQASAALSKGKFNRQIIQGIEANQGPYRLTGAENEPFIVILSGTERVYIDGKLLQRGQELDYTIDYNTSELIFTARNQITKDIRIVVEFQYSDQNYARSLFQSSLSYKSKNMQFWVNAYSEQDAKNQALQQTLSGDQKLYLSQIGDNLDLARINSIDSVGYLENQVLYKMMDSLSYDSVLVFSNDAALAVFRATFQFVGANQGNYIFSNYTALGKVFKWVAPIAGIPQGDHTPSRLIITPKQKQVVSSGFSAKLGKRFFMESESALSTNDLNTFSKFGSSDNNGFAQKFKGIYSLPFGLDTIKKWKFEASGDVEYLTRNFSPIEQYRSVEFDRDWNTRNKGYNGDQLATALGTHLSHQDFGKINLEGQYFSIGNDYAGNRVATNGAWQQNGWKIQWDGSALKSESNSKNTFVRHRAAISKDVKWLTIGFKDDHEKNIFSDTNKLVLKNSYQFFDYQFFISNRDSSKVNYKLFWRERFDQRGDSLQLTAVAKAKTIGAELKLSEFKNQRLSILSAYRSLAILDSVLLPQTPENSFVGRIEYDATFWKSALTFNSFYEIGSGLEQKREFLYLKVNDGQGIYAWVDYNADGIKDLNEFEVAQFIDQASYIRVFTPSSEYIKTYSNELNQSLFWRPERIWEKKKGALKFLNLFSDQARLRITKKVNEFDARVIFNPFASDIDLPNLVSTNTSIRNTLFFNRLSRVFSAEITSETSKSKTLLTSGFDSKQNQFNQALIRWNITTTLSLELSALKGAKKSLADYVIGRNYAYSTESFAGKIIFQKSSNFRISLQTRAADKINDLLLGGEKCLTREIGGTLKYNQTEKGSFQSEFKMLTMKYSGNPNSAIGFELLESLQPGLNYTWTCTYQRTLSQNLQLSINYLGRKSEVIRTIHSGSMELRAYF